MKTDLSRRSFLQLVGGVGASFMLGGFAAIACGEAGGAEQDPFVPNVFLRIDPDGACTVSITRSDMGQGVRTTLAMLVAEELDADWAMVRVTQAPGDRATYGGMGTGGSSSVRGTNQQLRRIGASARAMLVAAAAKQWGVDPSACRTEAGKVLGPNGQSLGYGALTTAAKEIPIPTDVKLKDRAEFKIIGKPQNRVDNRDVVTGKAIYGADVRREGMLHAVCLRPPVFGTKAETIDDAKARAVPGVVDVFAISSGVAVVANNTWAALKGREALEVKWAEGAKHSTASLREAVKAAAKEPFAMPEGAKRISANYELPYLAHATMETLNAVADVRDDRVEVWTGSQSPDSAQNNVARATGLTPDKVVIHNLLLGGGFGRKFSNEWVGEAVEISKRMKKPVQLLWSRECDMQHDLYRPMSEHALAASLDADGKPLGFSHQYLQAPGRGSGDYGTNTYLPYEIPNAGLRSAGVPSNVPTGAWRSVEHSQIIVANECFIDELAHAAGKDPFEFRKSILKNERLLKVLVSVAEKAQWGKSMPKGSGQGIACFEGYGSRIAHVVEVTVKDDTVRVDRMVAVVDAGTTINPRGVEAQIQGGFMDGLATALYAEITIDGGATVESNWSDYGWTRMTDTPKMEIFIEDSGGAFGGMGEVGYPSVPAAIANAVFAATGKRVRKFPIRISELV